MAISDKLNYLLETKQAIKQAIIDKGQEVADTDTFRSYAEKIEAIEAGGSGGSGGAYDIEQVLNEATGAFELRITDAIGEKEFTVMLPSAFATATQIHYFQVNKDVILFSGNVSNIGVWEYDIKTRTFEQLYEKSNAWRIFKIVGKDCFIANYEGNTGLLLYKSSTRSVIKIYANRDSWQYFQQVSETDWLIGSEDTSTTGVLLYNTLTNEITVAYPSGTRWQKFQKVGDYFLILSNYGNNGILLYDIANKTITQIYTNYNGYYFMPIGDNCLINGAGASYILLYESATKTITQLYENNGNYDTVYQVSETDWLIGSSAGSYGYGVLLYDSIAKTITQIYTEDKGWSKHQKVGASVLIGSAYNRGKGILLYEIATRTITQIYATGYWSYFQLVGNDCLIGGSENGIFIYEDTTKTLTKIYAASAYWMFFEPVGEDCLISSSNSSTGLLLYNSNDKTITKISSLGYYYNTFEFDVNGNVYVSSSNKDNSKYTFYYNATTKTATLAGYYVEVE